MYSRINSKYLYYFILGLLSLIFFQNIIAISLSEFINIKFIIAIKDIFVFSFFILGFGVLVSRTLLTFRLKKPSNLDLLMIFLTIYVIIYFFLPIGSSNTFSKLISLRQLLIIPIFYFLGRFSGNIDLKALHKSLLTIGLIIICFGFIEYFLLKDEFWINLNIYEYMKQKGMEKWAFGPGGIPGNFYTYDFINLIGEPLRRNVTLLVEPTLSGHFLSYFIVYTFLTGKFLLFLLFLISLILTLSKGGAFVSVLSFLIIISKSLNKSLRILLLINGFALMIIFIYISYIYSPSMKNHVYGLINNFYLLFTNPVGYGLGSSGNFAKLYSEDIEGAGESFFGALIGQTGFIGGILYLLIIIELLKIVNKNKINSYYDIAFAVSLSTMAAGFLSESAISFVGSGFIFFILGIVYSKYLQEEKWKKFYT